MQHPKLKVALHWIVALLKEKNIPFQITGGLAAWVYGSKRPIADIDIDIPEDRLRDIFAATSEHVTFGPARYKDGEWDLELLRLNYDGQEIDIGGAGTARYFDKKHKNWVNETVDFTKSNHETIFGISVPVVQREDLIKLKTGLGRDVDTEDLRKIA